MLIPGHPRIAGSASELGLHDWKSGEKVKELTINNEGIFTSFLLGKNQHIAPARLPRVIPSANSIGPRNILNIRSSKRISKRKQNNKIFTYIVASLLVTVEESS